MVYYKNHHIINNENKNKLKINGDIIQYKHKGERNQSQINESKTYE